MSSPRTYGGYSVPQPLAIWNPARGVWEVPETENLICEHSELYSATWPSSGMTRNGWAYALPTSAPRMDDSASSSLLPTPLSISDSPAAHSQGGGRFRTAMAAALALLPTPSVADGTGGHLTRSGDLLPTPTSRDWKDGSPNPNVETNGLLGREVWNLLPTPRATDGTKGGPNQRGSSGDLMLPSAVTQLLPTPTAQAANSADDRGAGTLDDCNLWSVAARIGETTNPPSDDGNEC